MSSGRFRDTLFEMVEELNNKTIPHMDVGSGRRCEVCGSYELNLDELVCKAGGDTYTTECLECGRETLFFHLWVELRGDIGLYQERFIGGGCRKCGYEVDMDAIVEVQSPVEERRYRLPAYSVINTRIHEHHTSYEPEETILVCAKCHSNIHADNEFHPELEPDMSRREWEATES